MRINTFIIIATLTTGTLSAQVLTREDSLRAGLIQKDASTLISGYGEAKVSYDLVDKTGTANLTRNVLFVGHRFSSKISMFSEWEMEDAKVAGGELGGEIALEQMFLKFNINKDIYLAAGLFTPRFGIMNENHLPTTYNGNDRNFVETLIIPATWRELGVGLYGQTPKIPGLNYSIALVNGLNAEEFGNGNGIREGRFEGRDATAGNLAVTGSLLYYAGPFRFQCSGYYGGSLGIEKSIADTLHLKSGPFGTPVMMTEADLQFNKNGFSFRALGTIGKIPDADSINSAFGNSCPEMIWGAYAELGYNIMNAFGNKTKELNIFARYESLDVNGTTSENSEWDPTLRQSYFVTGITFKPLRGIAIKADYVQRITATPTGLTNNSGFVSSRGFFNLGLGYSF
jgi:hypothetical protein